MKLGVQDRPRSKPIAILTNAQLTSLIDLDGNMGDMGLDGIFAIRYEELTRAITQGVRRQLGVLAVQQTDKVVNALLEHLHRDQVLVTFSRA